MEAATYAGCFCTIYLSMAPCGSRAMPWFGLVLFPLVFKAPVTHTGLRNEKLKGEESHWKAQGPGDGSLLKPSFNFSKGCF